MTPQNQNRALRGAVITLAIGLLTSVLAFSAKRYDESKESTFAHRVDIDKINAREDLHHALDSARMVSILEALRAIADKQR